MASNFDGLAVELLLDDNQKLLTELADKLEQHMHIALGNKCPLCGGKNVYVQESEGLCEDCDDRYDAPTELTVQVLRNKKGRIVELEWDS